MSDPAVHSGMHGGPDSRVLPQARIPEAVAEVIPVVVSNRSPDVYMRPGARRMMLENVGALGQDALLEGVRPSTGRQPMKESGRCVF